MRGVRISRASNVVIAGFSCIGTLATMMLGRYLGAYIPAKAANTAGSLILILIGLWFLASFISEESRESGTGVSTLAAERSGAGETTAEKRRISRRETLTLAAALAVNNMILGIGGSITGLSPVFTSVCTFFFSMIFIAAGQSLGRTWLSSLFGRYANLASGFIILAMGVYEIFV